MRTNQTCSERDAKEKRLKELEEMLLERDYPKISNQRNKLSSKRCGFKTCFQKNNQYKTSFCGIVGPRLPSVQSLTSKHYRSPTGQDPYLWEVFPKPPMVAFKRQRFITKYIFFKYDQ